jgi:hypothetical protein
LYNAAYPEAVLSLPFVVLLKSAAYPEAVFSTPLFVAVGPPSAALPMPVLWLASLVSLEVGTCA